MKSYKPKFSMGSLFVCSKCGQDFSDTEKAESLKTNLRSKLKNESNDHLKVRVMVSSCLGVCEKGKQAFGYYPNEGSLELFSADPLQVESEILNLIKEKITI